MVHKIMYLKGDSIQIVPIDRFYILINFQMSSSIDQVLIQQNVKMPEYID